ncbi:hypothetical protein [Nocardioides acrostichi]|uniref:Uncharacterized protein n=1 Tax=Nocardioides acrostichi TaxID=2784339 RepID=A0A930V672_9ACTN|nr:hypothetical protein [Nocardioides acrostichi]MBF4163909.1 hypothetical protein [Nocardioides acrostichi]
MAAVTTENDEVDVTVSSWGSGVGRAAARRTARAEMPGYQAAADLAASGALDELFAQIDAGEIELTGDGGFKCMGNLALPRSTDHHPAWVLP